MAKDPAGTPLDAHTRRAEQFRTEVAAQEAKANRLSMVQLAAFVASAVFIGAGVSQDASVWLYAGAVSVIAFVAARVMHIRTTNARDLARTRQAVHLRHIRRLTGGWVDFPQTGAGRLRPEHPYAWDVDLVGPGSLFQRIDVTHTRSGERALLTWLSSPSDLPTIRKRQAAVEELAADLELRQELEAAAELAAGDDKLDANPFLEFVRSERFYDERKALAVAIHVVPLASLSAFVAWQLGAVPGYVLAVPLLASLAISYGFARKVSSVFDLVAARRGFFEAYGRMMRLCESAELRAELLVKLQKRLQTEDGTPPSEQLRRLDRWAGLSDFRTQAIVHFFVNPLVLWDLHVLLRLDSWNRDVGTHLEEVFEALGELEALASLATLHHQDPTARFPELVDQDSPFEAEGLAHPLLSAGARVENDVTLRGPGTALIVTGSNMAGKSTLLRSVGLNIVLALAGGPVCAKSLKVPRVRLRASMRANDDLQRGASYFHAELVKLRGVVADADRDPPVFFLLDELLRGTNAHARHVGARAVLTHLLDRRATGLVATHDVALSKLEDERPEQVRNAHFTDVVIDGEMVFDYRLRDGVVKTSNALRLLKMAGIDVEVDDSLGNPLPAAEE